MSRCACELQAEEVAREAEVADLVLLADGLEGGRHESWVADEAAIVDVCAN